MNTLDWILIVALVVTNFIWFHLLRLASRQLKFLSRLIILERNSKNTITSTEP